MSGRHLLVVSLALVGLALPALALPALAAGAGEEPLPAVRPAPLVRIDEGRWLLYKGTLKVVSRRVGDEPSELQAALEAAYLGLGASGSDGAAREVLLLRAGESPEDNDIAASEAVSLLADP